MVVKKGRNVGELYVNKKKLSIQINRGSRCYNIIIFKNQLFFSKSKLRLYFQLQTVFLKTKF